VELHRSGEMLHVTPQVLIEFRNVGTRPVMANGLGLSAADAETQASTFEARFPLLAGHEGHLPGMEGSGGCFGSDWQAGA
jgi:hypothetical protein